MGVRLTVMFHWMCMQITRLHKGKEHVEVEFIVSIPDKQIGKKKYFKIQIKIKVHFKSYSLTLSAISGWAYTY